MYSQTLPFLTKIITPDKKGEDFEIILCAAKDKEDMKEYFL